MTDSSHASQQVVSMPRPNRRAAVRLFCLPHAGGSASFYDPWARELPELVELCTVQLPGRESLASLPLRTSIPELVDFLEPAVAEAIDRPWAVFGHSMGAILGFELLRRLERKAAHRALHFFPSCRCAPQRSLQREPIHALPRDRFIEALQRYRGIPEAILADRDVLDRFLPLLRADMQAIATYAYTPGDPLLCPITALGAVNDPDAQRELLTPWRAQTSGTFAVRMFPGDHFFLRTNRARLLQIVAEEVELELRH